MRNKAVRCHRGGRSGHLMRECRQYRGIICFGCNRPGHRKDECPQRKRLPQNLVARTSDVKLIDNARMNNVYKKKCFIQEKEICVYLDTGSEVNVMTYE
jgi:hypothetical protein